VCSSDLFTINSSSGALYDFSFEFFQVPAPGSVALASIAGLAAMTRRRSKS